ncbi:MAG: alpha/beta hydrolase-fold protein [Hyphomicrobiaceae bacterium]|nr:alpha/beta hydrolase-fold protein [Hyphomicrobiaceae bacterium]
MQAQSVILKEDIPSAALARPFAYVVYLPKGYAQGDKRYPVLYLLHGAGGDEATWTKEGAVQTTVDRLIDAGSIPPAIIVMPGCKTCWWVDGAQDRAETAFWNELVPSISRRYRVIEGRRGRLIAGLSAGGYGAVRFAMRYPERVAAIAALSPAVYADLPPEISAARAQPPFRKADGSFDDRAWKEKNYPSSIDAYFAQPNKVAFYLMSGDNDRYGIAFETVTLFKRLYDRQPELAELRIVDGDHSWGVWSLALGNALPFLFRHADKPQPMLMAAAPPNAPHGPPSPAPAHKLPATATSPLPLFP